MIGRLLLAAREWWKPPHDPDGVWVAEAWVEWEICRGSTLYRERFNSIGHAECAAKKGARDLDFWLPRRWGMGIKWGVRRACSADTGHHIWSPYMPGSKHCTGEHRTAHPLERVACSQ
jgi:hypothetical protein